jgi:hypothetical protein
LIYYVEAIEVPLRAELICVLQGEDCRPHAVAKERVVFLHVDYVESIFPLSLGEEFKVEPVSIPFGIDIVL